MRLYFQLWEQVSSSPCQTQSFSFRSRNMNGHTKRILSLMCYPYDVTLVHASEKDININIGLTNDLALQMTPSRKQRRRRVGLRYISPLGPGAGCTGK